MWTGPDQSDYRTNVYEKEAIVREDLEIGKTHQCPDPDDPKKMKVRLFLHTYLKESNPTGTAPAFVNYY